MGLNWLLECIAAYRECLVCYYDLVNFYLHWHCLQFNNLFYRRVLFNNGVSCCLSFSSSSFKWPKESGKQVSLHWWCWWWCRCGGWPHFGSVAHSSTLLKLLLFIYLILYARNPRGWLRISCEDICTHALRQNDMKFRLRNMLIILNAWLYQKVRNLLLKK